MGRSWAFKMQMSFMKRKKWKKPLMHVLEMKMALHSREIFVGDLNELKIDNISKFPNIDK